MGIYSDGTSETGQEDRLKYTQIEGLVGFNHEDDAVFNLESDQCSVR